MTLSEISLSLDFERMPSIARDAAHRVASVRLVNHRMGSVAAAASRAKIDPVEVCSRMTRSASLQQNLIRIIFRNIRQKWVTKGAPPYVNARQHLQRQDPHGVVAKVKLSRDIQSQII